MGKTVMVIDDSASIRQIISMTLSDSGYSTLEAGNGVDALRLMSGNKIHAIICDVNMPFMNGIDFVKTVKGDPAYSVYKSTPIIMLTTESDADKIQDGKSAGASAWMVKPFQAENLLGIVNKL